MSDNVDIKQLVAEVSGAAGSVVGQVLKLGVQMDELRAENDRLRYAMGKILLVPARLIEPKELGEIRDIASDALAESLVRGVPDRVINLTPDPTEPK